MATLALALLLAATGCTSRGESDRSAESAFVAHPPFCLQIDAAGATDTLGSSALRSFHLTLFDSAVVEARRGTVRRRLVALGDSVASEGAWAYEPKRLELQLFVGNSLGGIGIKLRFGKDGELEGRSRIAGGSSSGVEDGGVVRGRRVACPAGAAAAR